MKMFRVLLPYVVLLLLVSTSVNDGFRYIVMHFIGT